MRACVLVCLKCSFHASAIEESAAEAFCLQLTVWSSLRCPLTPILLDMVSVLSGGMSLPLIFVIGVGTADKVFKVKKLKGKVIHDQTECCMVEACIPMV